MLFFPIGDGILCRKQPIFDYAETVCSCSGSRFCYYSHFPRPQCPLELGYAFSIIFSMFLCLSAFHFSFMSVIILSLLDKKLSGIYFLNRIMLTSQIITILAAVWPSNTDFKERPQLVRLDIY